MRRGSPWLLLAAQMSERAEALRRLLAHRRREVDAQRPQANPAYAPRRAGEWWNRRTIQPTEAPVTRWPGPRRGRP
ncbi:MAG: hypothetical protein IRY99_00115 [Isosphaeraceae bacterium]|nr:hypothetical protein [Isosphaeraceae bacterium]